jgi:hypothetical protein
MNPMMILYVARFAVFDSTQCGNTRCALPAFGTGIHGMGCASRGALQTGKSCTVSCAKGFRCAYRGLRYSVLGSCLGHAII